MLYPSWYDVMDQLVCDLKATDITFPIVHVDKQVGEMISTFLRSKSYSDTITVESTSMRKDGSIEIEKLNRSLDYIYGKLEE